MKSKKNESVSVEETVVNGVVQVAKADVEERQKINCSRYPNDSL